MKLLKLSSIVCLFLFFTIAFIPEASAKHHRSKFRTSFGLGFNILPPQPQYVAPLPVVPQPGVVVAPSPIQPAAPVYYQAYPYPGYVYAPQPVYVVRQPTVVYPSTRFSFSFGR